MKKTHDTAPATITTAQLEHICNLTERRLRQLAQDGKIPQPTGGRWPMVETIQRLFGFYQQHGPELSAEKLRKLRAERRMKEMQADKEAGRLLDRSVICPALRNLAMNQRAALQNKFEVEMPAKLTGLDPITIRARMAEAVDQICDMFQQSTRKWLDDAPPAESTEAK